MARCLLAVAALVAAAALASNTPPQQPELASLSASSAAPGATLRLAGTNLDTVTSLSFNGARVKFTRDGSGGLTAIVPALPPGVPSDGTWALSTADGSVIHTGHSFKIHGKGTGNSVYEAPLWPSSSSPAAAALNSPASITPGEAAAASCDAAGVETLTSALRAAFSASTSSHAEHLASVAMARLAACAAGGSAAAPWFTGTAGGLAVMLASRRADGRGCATHRRVEGGLTGVTSSGPLSLSSDVAVEVIALPGWEAAAALRASAAGELPLRGVLLQADAAWAPAAPLSAGGAAAWVLVLAPSLVPASGEPECSPAWGGYAAAAAAAAAASAPDPNPAADATPRCLLGRAFYPVDGLHHAAHVALAGSAAAHRRALALPLAPRHTAALALSSSPARRQLFTDPFYNTGARRVLAVRVRYSDVPATSDTIVSLQTLKDGLEASVAAFNRSALGAVSLFATVASVIVQVSTTLASCTNANTLTPSIYTSLAAAGYAPDSFQHVVMVFPSCAGWDWAGLASTPGRDVWVNGKDSAVPTVLVHELGHNMGAAHAGNVHPTTGAWGEYADTEDWMGGSSIYERRDFSGGYKTDLGFLPPDKVQSVGIAPPAGGWAPGSRWVAPLKLVTLDAGTPALTAGGPLTVRLPHPASSGPEGDGSGTYLTYRASSGRAPNGVAIHYVPFNLATVGESQLTDTTSATPALTDSALNPGEAATVPLPGGGTALVEVLSTSTTAAPGVSALDVRVSKLEGSGLPAGIPRGCYGGECQPAPAPAATLTTTCATAPWVNVTASVPLRQLAYPTLFTLADTSLSTGENGKRAVGVRARLCLPPQAAATLALAGYDELPTAEAATTSPLTRGNARYVSRNSSAAWGCRDTELTLPLGGTRYLAAAAVWTPAFAAEVAAAGRLLPTANATLTLSCVYRVSNGPASLYGPSWPLMDAAKVALLFSNWAAASGVYEAHPAIPSYNGAPVWASTSHNYMIYWTSWVGGWCIDDYGPSASSISEACYSMQVDAGKSLAVLTSFGGAKFAATAVCPLDSVLSADGTGCYACPSNSRAIPGALSTSASLTDLPSSLCTCRPGYYMATDAAGRGACTACAAGTAKPTAGNAASACVACKAGLVSAAGARWCEAPPAASASSPAPACSRISITGYVAGLNGLYTKVANTAYGSGRGVSVYARPEPGTPIFLVGAGSTWWFQALDPVDGDVLASLTATRLPSAWTTELQTPSYPDAAATCVCPAGANATALACTCPFGQAQASDGVCRAVTSVPCPVGTYRANASVSDATAPCVPCPVGLSGSSATSFLTCDRIVCAVVNVTVYSATLYRGYNPSLSGLYKLGWQDPLDKSKGTMLNATFGNGFWIWQPRGYAGTYFTSSPPPIGSYMFKSNTVNIHPSAINTWVGNNLTFACYGGTDGWYVQRNGTLAPCPPGTTVPSTSYGVDRGYCSICAAGYYRLGSACLACPTDSYGAGGYVQACTSCPAGTSTKGATAVATAAGCAPLQPPVSAECGLDNGGCSHNCTDAPGGPVCSCPPGGVLRPDGKTCALCPSSLRATPDAGSGTCSACPEGLFRSSSSAATSACGCPYGFLVTATGACKRPATVTLDIPTPPTGSVSPKGADTSAPFRGTFVACRSGANDANGITWQLVSPASGAGSVPAPPMLRLDGATGEWAVFPASALAATVTGSSPRYAYLPASNNTAGADWPASVAYSSSGTLTATSIGQLPLGTLRWYAFAPWPAHFNPAHLTLTPGGAAAVDEGSLPLCGTATANDVAGATLAADVTPVIGSGTVPGPPSASPAPPSRSPPPTRSPTPSASVSGTPTRTASTSGGASLSASPTPSVTLSTTAAASPSVTPSPTTTASIRASGSPTRTVTRSSSPSPSFLSQFTRTPSGTPTRSRSATAARSRSVTPSRYVYAYSSRSRTPSQSRRPAVQLALSLSVTGLPVKLYAYDPVNCPFQCYLLGAIGGDTSDGSGDWGFVSLSAAVGINTAAYVTPDNSGSCAASCGDVGASASASPAPSLPPMRLLAAGGGDATLTDTDVSLQFSLAIPQEELPRLVPGMLNPKDGAVRRLQASPMFVSSDLVSAFMSKLTALQGNVSAGVVPPSLNAALSSSLTQANAIVAGDPATFPGVNVPASLAVTNASQPQIVIPAPAGSGSGAPNGAVIGGGAGAALVVVVVVLMLASAARKGKLRKLGGGSGGKVTQAPVMTMQQPYPQPPHMPQPQHHHQPQPMPMQQPMQPYPQPGMMAPATMPGMMPQPVVPMMPMPGMMMPQPGMQPMMMPGQPMPQPMMMPGQPMPQPMMMPGQPMPQPGQVPMGQVVYPPPPQPQPGYPTSPYTPVPPGMMTMGMPSSPPLTDPSNRASAGFPMPTAPPADDPQ